MIPIGLEEVLSVLPDVQGGAVCFAGTRVTLQVFLDNIGEGMPMDEFLSEYPTVSRDQALAVLRWQQEATRKAVGLESRAS